MATPFVMRYSVSYRLIAENNKAASHVGWPAKYNTRFRVRFGASVGNRQGMFTLLSCDQPPDA